MLCHLNYDSIIQVTCRFQAMLRIHYHLMDIGLISINIIAGICAHYYHRYTVCIFVVLCFDLFKYAARKHDPTYWHFPIKGMSIVFWFHFFRHAARKYRPLLWYLAVSATLTRVCFHRLFPLKEFMTTKCPRCFLLGAVEWHTGILYSYFMNI